MQRSRASSVKIVECVGAVNGEGIDTKQKIKVKSVKYLAASGVNSSTESSNVSKHSSRVNFFIFSVKGLKEISKQLFFSSSV